MDGPPDLLSDRGGGAGGEKSSFLSSPCRLFELNSALERARRGELRAALTSPRRALLCALSPSASPRASPARSRCARCSQVDPVGPQGLGLAVAVNWLAAGTALCPAPLLSPASPFTRRTRLSKPDHFTRPAGLGALLTHFLCAPPAPPGHALPAASPLLRSCGPACSSPGPKGALTACGARVGTCHCALLLCAGSSRPPPSPIALCMQPLAHQHAFVVVVSFHSLLTQQRPWCFHSAQPRRSTPLAPFV